MRAGDLDNRITIQEKAPTTQNQYGEEVPSWSDVITVWAAIEPLKGREYLESKLAAAEVTTRIRMRYQPGVDITPAMRVSWSSRVFEIVDVINPKMANKELQLMCVEQIRS